MIQQLHFQVMTHSSSTWQLETSWRLFKRALFQEQKLGTFPVSLVSYWNIVQQSKWMNYSQTEQYVTFRNKMLSEKNQMPDYYLKSNIL